MRATFEIMYYKNKNYQEYTDFQNKYILHKIEFVDKPIILKIKLTIRYLLRGYIKLLSNVNYFMSLIKYLIETSENLIRPLPCPSLTYQLFVLFIFQLSGPLFLWQSYHLNNQGGRTERGHTFESLEPNLQNLTMHRNFFQLLLRSIK